MSLWLPQPKRIMDTDVLFIESKQKGQVQAEALWHSAQMDVVIEQSGYI